MESYQHLIFKTRFPADNRTYVIFFVVFIKTEPFKAFRIYTGLYFYAIFFYSFLFHSLAGAFPVFILIHNP